MFKTLWVATIALALMGSFSTTNAVAAWGKDYFPNVILTTHEGKKVRFFEDLIKDKIVAINFIYTNCPDTCPLETAQLVKVQSIMGDRVGKDVFFYSISIDPERDTPEVLTEYRKRFNANWMFLTGNKKDIVEIRKKLGLYIKEIQAEGSLNHNVSMIIGNQKTGRWMKRAPFENPYVLADQLGNWLSGWVSPPRIKDFAEAPDLRNITPGEQMFRNRCSSCHTITGKELAGALGPDLLGVTRRREQRWLLDWLQAPDEMIKKKDPIAMAMYKKYNNLVMPNMRLHQEEAQDLLYYMEDETQRLLDEAKNKRSSTLAGLTSEDIPSGDVVAVMNAWVRETDAAAKVNAGYMTLINVGDADVTLLSIESDLFDKVEVHEMVNVDGLMEMREVTDLKVPSKGRIAFEPGGKHLMLFGPREHVRVGQKVDMVLTFASGEKQNVSVKVAAR